MRIGIIGVGSISKNHIHALKQIGHEIVALCDVLPERCHAANETFGLHAAVYEDYIRMLDEVALDAVHICTPHHLHTPMCCEALGRNIHVLCEKPFAISEEQLATLEAAVKASSATIGVCHQNRYNAPIRYAKQFFEGREITAAVGSLVWARDKKYYAGGAWRGLWATEGGGVMINQALHTLDLLGWFCGYPKSVKAHIANDSLEGVIEVEDTAHGIFTLANGGNFIVHATNAAKANFPVNIMLHEGNDTVLITGTNTVLVNGEHIPTEEAQAAVGKAEWGTGHFMLIRDFYDCIEQGKPFPIDFAEGSKVVRLILGMYESNGEEIAL